MPFVTFSGHSDGSFLQLPFAVAIQWLARERERESGKWAQTCARQLPIADAMEVVVPGWALTLSRLLEREEEMGTPTEADIENDRARGCCPRRAADECSRSGLSSAGALECVEANVQTVAVWLSSSDASPVHHFAHTAPVQHWRTDNTTTTTDSTV